MKKKGRKETTEASKRSVFCKYRTEFMNVLACFDNLQLKTEKALSGIGLKTQIIGAKKRECCQKKY